MLASVLQVRYVGEREMPERMTAEHLRTEERVIDEVVTSPCSPLQCGGGNCGPTSRTMGNGKQYKPMLLLVAVCISSVIFFGLYLGFRMPSPTMSVASASVSVYTCVCNQSALH